MNQSASQAIKQISCSDHANPTFAPRGLSSRFTNINSNALTWQLIPASNLHLGRAYLLEFLVWCSAWSDWPEGAGRTGGAGCHCCWCWTRAAYPPAGRWGWPARREATSPRGSRARPRFCAFATRGWAARRPSMRCSPRSEGGGPVERFRRLGRL